MQNPRDVLILEFDGTIADYDGELLLGWYYQPLDQNGEPDNGLMGPYETAPEAEAACRRAFHRGEI